MTAGKEGKRVKGMEVGRYMYMGSKSGGGLHRNACRVGATGDKLMLAVGGR